ncbi:MAG: hypothetical protein LBE12_10385 [Planctomycetaceae bacterium]|jgi:hypothetical protein|nr:hypothetical protein [Planctomycetaceae bacterium]
MGIGLFCTLIGLFFIVICYDIYYINYYRSIPQKTVAKKDLAGTWKLQRRGLYLIPNATKSLMILQENGTYEIHNPPRYILEQCNLEAKIYRSPTCSFVIVGEWSIINHWESMMVFKSAKNIHQFIRGSLPPYQIHHYANMDPDREPPYRWNMISKETKCPYCPDEVIDEKNLISVDSIPKTKKINRLPLSK